MDFNADTADDEPYELVDRILNEALMRDQMRSSPLSVRIRHAVANTLDLFEQFMNFIVLAIVDICTYGLKASILFVFLCGLIALAGSILRNLPILIGYIDQFYRLRGS